MVKILHTADIHLGLKFSGLGRSGDRLRAHLKKTFMKIIDLALERNIDILLIAGDLFNSNQVSKATLGFALGEISRLGKIQVCLIPGTHDCYDNSSIYRNIDPGSIPPNLHILGDKENPFIFFEEFGTTVYGKGNRSNRSRESPLPGLNQNLNSKYNIALAHGSIQIPSKSQEDDFPMTSEEIEKSGFDYIALGHWHSLEEVSKTPKTFYSGSPEQLKFGEKDCGNVLLVGLDEKQTSIEKTKIGELRWEELELFVERFKNSSEILREIEKYKGEQNILRVNFKGDKRLSGTIDLSEIKEVLEDQFLYLELEDQTHSYLEEFCGSEFPQHTVMGQFMRIVEEKTKATEEKEKKKYQEAKTLGYLLLNGEKGF